MRIRKPRGITTTQLMVTTLVGALGGFYIYKPLLEENRKNRAALHNDNIQSTEATTSIKPVNTAVSSVSRSEQTAVAKYNFPATSLFHVPKSTELNFCHCR